MIAACRDRISLYNMDAISFINFSSQKLKPTTVFCIDPPYYLKGPTLYTNFYGPQDHANISATLKNLAQPWILTYDNVPQIRALYNDQKKFVYSLNHSLATKRISRELLITSDNLMITSNSRLTPVIDA